jgi:excisionase family DNA binding protein
MTEFTYTHPALVALSGRLTVSVEEAAKLLGIGRSAAYDAVRKGELPTRRIGRRIVVPVPLLVEWLGAAAPAA